MEYKYFIFCITVAFVTATNHESDDGSNLNCPPKNYFDFSSNKCKECTKCGSNQIIRKPCELLSDARCGPFFEFDKFHQAKNNNLLPAYGNGSKNGPFSGGSAKIHVEHIDNSEFATDRTDGNVDPSAPVEVNKDEKWYTLAMVLLGVLCVVSLFVVLYIVMVCFVCKKRTEEKQVIYDPEFTTPLTTPQVPRYVEMTSRDRLKKTPTTTYTEETDDSGSNNRVIINPYLPICGNESVEYDADNSGQTVSSTSTNYVYFKAPSTRPEAAEV